MDDSGVATITLRYGKENGTLTLLHVTKAGWQYLLESVVREACKAKGEV